MARRPTAHVAGPRGTQTHHLSASPQFLVSYVQGVDIRSGPLMGRRGAERVGDPSEAGAVGMEAVLRAKPLGGLLRCLAWQSDRRAELTVE